MWTLVSDAVAVPYRKNANGIVYRPFREPPIACWLALVWLPPASSLIDGSCTPLAIGSKPLGALRRGVEHLAHAPQ